MNGSTFSKLKCLGATVAVTLFAAPTVQATAAGSQPVLHRARAAESAGNARYVEPDRAEPNGPGKSYFWSDVAIVGGSLAGIVVLGLWGDLAIAGLLLGFQLLCAGVASRVGKGASRPHGSPHAEKSFPFSQHSAISNESDS